MAGDLAQLERVADCYLEGVVKRTPEERVPWRITLNLSEGVPHTTSGGQNVFKRFTASITPILRSERVVQFVKFCCMGGSGVTVDMAALALTPLKRNIERSLLPSMQEVMFGEECSGTTVDPERQPIGPSFKPHAERVILGILPSSYRNVLMLLKLVVLGFFGFYTDSCGATNCVVNGALQYETTNPEGAILLKGSKQFSIFITSKGWMMRVEDDGVNAGARRGPWLVETGFDGKDVHHVARFSKQEVERAREENPTVFAIQDFAFVQEGDFPFDATIDARLLWLAFCSREFFRTNTSFVMPSLFPVIVTNYLQYRLSVSPDESGLPQLLSIHCPGHSLTRSHATQHVQTVVQLPRPFHLGYEAATYSVARSTNFDGVWLPLAAELRFYILRQKPDGEPERYMSDRYEIVVSAVTNSSDDMALRPKLERATWISDTRFSSYVGRRLSYEGGTEGWLGRADNNVLQKAARLASLPARASRPAIQPTPMGWLKWMVILILLIPPFVLFWRRRGIHHKHHNQTGEPT